MGHLVHDGSADQFGRVWYNVVCDGEEIGRAYRYTTRSSDDEDGTYEARFCSTDDVWGRASKCVVREFKGRGQALRWLKVKAGMMKCRR